VAEARVVELGAGLAARVQEAPGSKVLWLHGYTLDSRSWRNIWACLPGWHHVGLDLPGHGASAPIGKDDDLKRVGRRVADLCLERGIRHMAALSFGTLTATQVMIEEPEHFRSVVLAAPSLAGGPQDPEVGLSYARLGHLFHTVGPGEQMKDAWMSCVAWAGIEKQPDLREELGRLVAQHRWLELAGWGMMRMLQPTQSEEDLRRVRSPVLVLIGELDLPAFHESARVLGRALPRCETLTLPGIHHLCMLEAPEASAEIVRQHLEAHDRDNT
jgi:2-succinyl-6-hydroxy-2,4-cyclohexadiene-1-carboxylate synthase